MPRRLAVILAAAALGGPAFAQSATTPAPPTPPAAPMAIAHCIWEALPARTRSALIASGPSIDDIGKAVSDMNPALMQLAQSQCPSPATREIDAAAKEAWAGTVMTNWAEGQLLAHYAITPATLARAWEHVPTASRRQIASGFDKAPEAVRANITGFAAELHLTAPAALDLLSAWAIAQVRMADVN